MARKPNYRFERSERARAKAAKKEKKEEKKRQRVGPDGEPAADSAPADPEAVKDEG